MQGVSRSLVSSSNDGSQHTTGMGEEHECNETRGLRNKHSFVHMHVFCCIHLIRSLATFLHSHHLALIDSLHPSHIIDSTHPFSFNSPFTHTDSIQSWSTFQTSRNERSETSENQSQNIKRKTTQKMKKSQITNMIE